VIFENIEEIEKLSLEEKRASLNPKNRFKLQSTLHRSNMMLNPLNLKHLNRLDSLDCDAVTLNLEDAIAPSKKEEALVNIAFFLSHLKECKSEIIIRTNPLNSGGREEIAFLKAYCFNAVRVSKVKTESEVEQALSLLENDTKLHISLETKEAFASLSQWSPKKNFERANIGILDLLADLKLPQSLLTIGNPAIAYILSKFLIDVKTIELEPVSFMFQDYRDTKTFKELCLWEKSLGFRSKACMGPSQVAIANEVFAPSTAEIERAVAIKKSFDEHSKKAIHGFLDEKYGFIDEPIYKDALNILDNLNI
jgi:citrate lyase subunit beta/citryl-CoA lyase